MANSFIFHFDQELIKRLLRNLALTGIAIFALDFSIGKALRHFYFSETSGFHFRTTYAMETTVADILVFGSSRANHHYVPDMFESSLNASIYNTGRDGQGMLFQTALLKAVLRRYTPKIILLEYEDDFGQNDDHSDSLASLLPYYKTHVEIRDIIDAKSPFEKIKLESEIYPFNSEILSIAIGNLDLNKNRNPENNGYVPLHGQWREKAMASTKGKAPPAIDAGKVAVFKNFLDLAKASGAQVFVIYSPTFRMIDKNPVLELGRQICQARDIEFFDFGNTEIFRNNLLFQDVDHLNHQGATIFSHLVAEKIKHSIHAKVTQQSYLKVNTNP